VDESPWCSTSTAAAGAAVPVRHTASPLLHLQLLSGNEGGLRVYMSRGIEQTRRSNNTWFLVHPGLSTLAQPKSGSVAGPCSVAELANK